MFGPPSKEQRDLKNMTCKERLAHLKNNLRAKMRKRTWWLNVNKNDPAWVEEFLREAKWTHDQVNKLLGCDVQSKSAKRWSRLKAQQDKT